MWCTRKGVSRPGHFLSPISIPAAIFGISVRPIEAKDITMRGVSFSHFLDEWLPHFWFFCVSFYVAAVARALNPVSPAEDCNYPHLWRVPKKTSSTFTLYTNLFPFQTPDFHDLLSVTSHRCPQALGTKELMPELHLKTWFLTERHISMLKYTLGRSYCPIRKR